MGNYLKKLVMTEKCLLKIPKTPFGAKSIYRDLEASQNLSNFAMVSPVWIENGMSLIKNF